MSVHPTIPTCRELLCLSLPPARGTPSSAIASAASGPPGMRALATLACILSWVAVEHGSAHAEPPAVPSPEKPDDGERDPSMPAPGAPDEGASGESGESGAAPATTVVDFGEDEGFGIGDVMTTQDPTPLKHESLIRKKFRGPDPSVVAASAEPAAPTASRWSLGVHLDLGAAALVGDDAAGLDTGLGGAFGGFAQYAASRHIVVQPGVRLTSRGALPAPVAEDPARSQRLLYLEVPALVGLELPAGRAVFGLRAGPSLGVALNGSVGEAEVERFHLAAVLNGFGRVRLGGAEWSLDARFEQGLTSVLASSAGGLGRAIRHRAMSLGVGYWF